MAKIYSKTSDFNPKEETINFILSYSKALKVINYNDLKFEVILN